MPETFNFGPVKIFVSGTDTDAGKTLASAILARGLKADYWKPIQSGFPPDSDRETVERLTPETRTFKEKWVFKAPTSPHYAATLEGRSISLSDITLPKSKRLVVEGAGGLLVPLNQKETMIDLIQFLETPVVLVSRHKLGSINHTLMSIEVLQHKNIPIAGILFSGEPIGDTEDIITHFSGVKNLGCIREARVVDQNFVEEEANRLKDLWKEI